LAHGAWSAVAATSGVLELAPARGVSAPHVTVPVSCWRWLRGHLRGAGVGSGHPCGGTETGPNRADARIESTFRCRGLTGHRLMHGRGLPGPMHEGVDTIREHKTKTTKTTIKPLSHKTPIGGPPVYLRREEKTSSCRGCGPWAWASRESHD
jgi:hypothetical protein